MRIVQEIAHALKFLEDNKMIHGDIRPELISIPIKRNDNFRLIDRLADTSSPMAIQRANRSKDKPIYMSPAYVRYLSKASKRLRHNPYKSEMFSFGLVVLEAGLLDSVQSVYGEHKTAVDKQEVIRLVKRFMERYSAEEMLQEVLIGMLEFSEKIRQSPGQLLETIRRLKRKGQGQGQQERSRMEDKVRFTESGYEVVDLEQSISYSNFHKFKFDSSRFENSGEANEQSLRESLHQAQKDKRDYEKGNLVEKRDEKPKIGGVAKPSRFKTIEEERKKGGKRGKKPKSEENLKSEKERSRPKQKEPKSDKKTTKNKIPKVAKITKKTRNSSRGPVSGKKWDEPVYITHRPLVRHATSPKEIEHRNRRESRHFTSQGADKGKADASRAGHTGQARAQTKEDTSRARAGVAKSKKSQMNAERGDEPGKQVPGERKPAKRPPKGRTANEPKSGENEESEFDKFVKMKIESNFTYGNTEVSKKGSYDSDFWEEPNENDLLNFNAQKGSFRMNVPTIFSQNEIEPRVEKKHFQTETRPGGPRVCPFSGDKQFFTNEFPRAQMHKTRKYVYRRKNEPESREKGRREKSTVTIIRNGQKIQQNLLNWRNN